jgi:hypothetical protein
LKRVRRPSSSPIAITSAMRFSSVVTEPSSCAGKPGPRPGAFARACAPLRAARTRAASPSSFQDSVRRSGRGSSCGTRNSFACRRKTRCVRARPARETPCAVIWPPIQSVSSSSTTRRPARAAASAAATPPVPPPAIRTSQLSARSGSARDMGSTAGDGSPLAGTRITSTTASSARCTHFVAGFAAGFTTGFLPQ